jgi:hypothetical protein
MDRQSYDRLLHLAERADLSDEERVEFVEQAEALADAPGGLHRALPKLIRATALLGKQHPEVSAYLREAIGILRQMG